MEQAQARALFAEARVARLATVDDRGQPHLVPITFAVDGDLIVHAIDHKPKRTTDLKRLRNLAANPAVSVLVDAYQEDWSALWWVRADGRARVWTEPATREPAVALLCAKYDQYARRPPAGPVVAVWVSQWRGWSFAQPTGG